MAHAQSLMRRIAAHDGPPKEYCGQVAYDAMKFSDLDVDLI